MKRFLMGLMFAVNGGLFGACIFGAIFDPEFGFLEARAVAEPAVGGTVFLTLLFLGNAIALWAGDRDA